MDEKSPNRANFTGYRPIHWPTINASAGNALIPSYRSGIVPDDCGNSSWDVGGERKNAPPPKDGLPTKGHEGARIRRSIRSMPFFFHSCSFVPLRAPSGAILRLASDYEDIGSGFILTTMTPAEIARVISEKFGTQILAAFPEDKHPRVHVAAENWRALAEFLIGQTPLQFDWLANLSGVDYVADDNLCVVYDLWSFNLRHRFSVKVFCPRENPHIPTVADLWPAADWHEREAFDLLGITFDGHPDLRRILLAEDWEGFPLRKDYIFPREYHGIPGSVELDWQNKPDYPK
jgi:NADH-quinone oxidoreductase subunit C